MTMYDRAKLAWGIAMPEPLKQLKIRDDAHVAMALQDVLYNLVSSPTWTVDARIAWAILQSRSIEAEG